MFTYNCKHKLYSTLNSISGGGDFLFSLFISG